MKQSTFKKRNAIRKESENKKKVRDGKPNAQITQRLFMALEYVKDHIRI